MRTRWLRIPAAALAVAMIPALAAAVDAPHDASFSDGKCDNCHTLYDTTSTGARSYAKGCLDCHATHAGGPSGFPWATADQATPGVSGNQHSWSGSAVNAKLGTTAPGAYSMTQRLVDGNLQCVVCHDAHHAAPENAPGAGRTSIPVGVPKGKSSGVGTGTMTLVTPGSNAYGVRVRIQTVGAGGGTFILAHDFGLATPTWLNWNAATSTWAAGTLTGTGKPFTDGGDVTLDAAAVTVRFSAGVAVADTWDFFVGYPFLRISNVASSMCTTCHGDRVMNATRGGGHDPSYAPNGARLFSHPVNIGLNANGRGYDRTEPNLVDANGVTQAIGDGNTSNDLRLDAGLVRCTSCHALHNADSNSLSVDAR
jgi:hypothetical protein